MLKVVKKTFYVFVKILVLVFLLSACRTMNPSTMFGTDKDYVYNDFEEEKTEYIIRPYDKLNVRIYTNNGIQLIDMENMGQSNEIFTYLVDKDGVVKLPSIGLIKVQGLTVKEAETLLEKKYTPFYQTPFVMVKVTNRRVTIFSSGSTRGTVLTIENEKFTLIEALAKAGGLDDFGKAYRIKLLRGDLKNPKVYLYNISQIEDMKKANMVLQANDIIYVEKRGRYTQRFLGEIMPFVTLFNTAVLIFVTFHSLKKTP